MDTQRYLARVDHVALRFRRARFHIFESLLDDLDARLLERAEDRPLRILDIGGRPQFWTDVGLDLAQHHVTVVNLPSDLRPSSHPSIAVAAGDARDLRDFSAGDFDVVFSNSVIEHVGVWEDQQRMANEVRRLAAAYFVETPNFWFPLEPHSYVPGFQLLPTELRVRLIRRFALGYLPRITDWSDAHDLAEHTRLVTHDELARLFPDATIVHESLLGMTKSLIAMRAPPATH